MMVVMVVVVVVIVVIVVTMVAMVMVAIFRDLILSVVYGFIVVHHRCNFESILYNVPMYNVHSLVN